MHWTQDPKNKEKLADMARRSAKTRNKNKRRSSGERHIEREAKRALASSKKHDRSTIKELIRSLTEERSRIDITIQTLRGRR